MGDVIMSYPSKEDLQRIKGVNIVLNEDLPPDTVKPKDLHGSTLEVSRDVYDKIQKEIRHDYRGLIITNKEANE